MARNEILVHNWGSEEEFRHCFADGLNQKLISACRAGYFQPSLLSVLSGLQNPILFYPWVLQPPPPPPIIGAYCDFSSPVENHNFAPWRYIKP